jgi:transcriptional regulator with XRE-family HTH domain
VLSFVFAIYIFKGMDMKDRLSKILTSEGLTPSLLADQLGVQRSGISHILSGRNFPSYDFLHRLLQRFTKLNAEWLILGQGTMYKSNIETITDEKLPLYPTLPSDLPKSSSAEAEETKKNADNLQILPVEKPEKSIKKMIIIYTDNTFATYSPESL